MCYYVNSMKDHFPDEYHPDEEWLSQGFEMISLDREWTITTDPKQGTSGVGGQGSGGPASATSSPLGAMQRMSRLLVLLTLSSALSRCINLSG